LRGEHADEQLVMGNCETGVGICRTALMPNWQGMHADFATREANCVAGVRMRARSFAGEHKRVGRPSTNLPLDTLLQSADQDLMENINLQPL
jgi:hypothetical protein